MPRALPWTSCSATGALHLVCESCDRKRLCLYQYVTKKEAYGLGKITAAVPPASGAPPGLALELAQPRLNDKSAAAKIFDRLDIRVLVEVATRISPQRMSDILAQMSPGAAERLTVELAGRSESKDPRDAQDPKDAKDKPA